MPKWIMKDVEERCARYQMSMCLAYAKELIKMAKRILTELTRDEIVALVDRIDEVMSDEFDIANSSIIAFWKCLDAGCDIPTGAQHLATSRRRSK